jgi:hypothetical protein
VEDRLKFLAVGLVLKPPVPRLEFSQLLATLPWWIIGSRMEGVR